MCDDCSNKKRCKDCNIMKNCNTFYSYKNGKLYSTCKVCFNKKVRCEFCNKELNRRYLRSHVKKQHLYQHYNRTASHTTAQLCDSSRDGSRTNINTRGDLLPTRQLSRQLSRQLPQLRDSCRDSFRTHLPTQLPTQLHAQLRTKLNNDDNNTDNNYDDNNNCNRTLIVGPSFCGKTHLLLNKLRLIRLEDPEKQIRIITRSPEQYEDVKLDLELGDIEVEENVGDLEEYRGCCVVFDDMLDSNQKLIDPFFTRGRHKSCDVYYLCQSYFDAPKKTVRNNSNIIILFQQTLKDVEHIHRDISGFDMSYEEFKSLCREAWNEKFNYLLINRLEDKNGSRYRICNESNPNYKIFNPQTDPLGN